MKKRKQFRLTACLILLLCAGFACQGCSSQKIDGTSRQLFYQKDSDIYQYDRETKTKKILIEGTTDSANPEGKIVLDYLYLKDGTHPTLTQLLLRMPTLSSDGRYLLYPNQYQAEDATYTLYGQDLQSKEQPFIIADNIWSYQFLDDSRVIYYTAEENDRGWSRQDMVISLYDFNTRETENCQIPLEEESQSGRILMFSKTDGCKALWQEIDYSGNMDLYLVDLLKPDGNKTLAASGLDLDGRLDYISDDLQTIYYILDKKLYCITGLKDMTKLTSDLFRLSVIEETGHAYYQTDLHPWQVMDFVDDDMMPEEEVIILDRSNYQDDAQYQKAIEELSERAMRESMRMPTDTYVGLDSTSTLYYFDGQKATKLSDQVNQVKILGGRNDLLAVYMPDWSSKLHTLKMSQIKNLEDAVSEVYDLEPVRTYSLVVNDQIFPVPLNNKHWNNLYFITADEDRKLLYYTDGEEEQEILYARPFSDEGLGDARIVDDKHTEIYLSEYQYTGSSVYYTAEFEENEETASIFQDGIRIDEQICDYMWQDNAFYYFKNYEEETGLSDLYQYFEGKSQLIGEHVWSYRPLPDKCVVFLSDYDHDKMQGTLNIRDVNGNLETIDQEVADFSGAMIGGYDRQ